MDKLKCVHYNDQYRENLEEYFLTIGADTRNNNSYKSIKADRYLSNEKGALFIILNEKDKIVGMSSILVENTCTNKKCARIFSRLHLTKECPQWAIDKFLEPASHKWLIENEIEHIYMTINQNDERTLGWVCTRVGIKRGLRKPNSFGHRLGEHIRFGWRPYNKMILEYNTWQYCLFYSPDNHFFLERPEKPLTSEAEEIYRKNFNSAIFKV